jgi:hypothetical protein
MTGNRIYKYKIIMGKRDRHCGLKAAPPFMAAPMACSGKGGPPVVMLTVLHINFINAAGIFC